MKTKRANMQLSPASRESQKSSRMAVAPISRTSTGVMTVKVDLLGCENSCEKRGVQQDARGIGTIIYYTIGTST